MKSDAVEHVCEVLDEGVDLNALGRALTAFLDECSTADVAHLCLKLAETLQLTSTTASARVFELFPWVIYLIKRLGKVALRQQRRSSSGGETTLSDSSVRMLGDWCAEATRHLAHLPLEFDDRLGKERGKPSEALQCLRKLFVSSATPAYDLLALVERLQALDSDKSEIRQLWPTFCRLDVKIGWITQQAPDIIWSRFFSSPPGSQQSSGEQKTFFANPDEVLKKLKDFLADCKATCRGDAPFTTNALLKMLDQVSRRRQADKKHLTLSDAIDLTCQFQPFAPNEQFGGDAVVDWLYQQVIMQPHHSLEEQRMQTCQLLAGAVVNLQCNDQMLKARVTSLVSTSAGFQSVLNTFQQTVAGLGVGSADDELNRALFDIHAFYVHAVKGWSVDVGELIGGLFSADSNIKDLCARITEEIFAQRNDVHLSSESTDLFGQDMTRLVDTMFDRGYPRLVSRHLVEVFGASREVDGIAAVVEIRPHCSLRMVSLVSHSHTVVGAKGGINVCTAPLETARGLPHERLSPIPLAGLPQ